MAKPMERVMSAATMTPATWILSQTRLRRRKKAGMERRKVMNMMTELASLAARMLAL